jgi:general secretion pathway protein B
MRSWQATLLRKNKDMSIILEALKKAESERKLGSVPDMHAQPFATAQVAARRGLNGPLAWSLSGAVLVLTAVVAWLMLWPGTRPPGLNASPPHVATTTADAGKDPESSPPVNGETPVTAMPDNTRGLIAQVPVEKETPSTDPQDTTPARAMKSTAEPKKNAEPKKSVEPKPKNDPEPAKRNNSAPPQSDAPARSRSESTARTVASAVEPRVPGLRELPDSIQREIPALTVGGYIYSSTPAERSVLINNRLLHEGSEITPGLTLEKMLTREAVLNYKGYRFRIPY